MNTLAIALGCGMLILILAIPVLPGSYPVSGGMQTDNLPGRPETLRLQRGAGIIRQTSELTCGPAAIASLLTFYFDDATSEDEIAKLSGTYQKRTSTLLGLRNACLAKGYEADGYQMSFTQLIQEVEESGIPVLVHFKEPSLHYALVLGQVDDFVLVSDPAVGHVSLDTADFMRRWDNKVLVVRSKKSVTPGLIVKRKHSAKTRLRSLDGAGGLMSTTRF